MTKCNLIILRLHYNFNMQFYLKQMTITFYTYKFNSEKQCEKLFWSSKFSSNTE